MSYFKDKPYPWHTAAEELLADFHGLPFECPHPSGFPGMFEGVCPHCNFVGDPL